MSVHKKKDGRWYVSYRDEYGKQHVKYFGRGRLAKKKAESYDLELKARRKLGERPERPSQIYLDHLAQRYIEDVMARGRSEKYLRDLANLLNNHILPILSHKPVDELTYEDMLEVARYYQHCSVATRNRYFTYLRAIFNWGVRYGITRNNPLAQWKKAKEPRRKVMLTVDDLKKIMKYASDHLRWAIEVEWNLGTRPGPSELLSIKWEHVDFDRGVVWIYATKTKEWRDVPISDHFRQRLLERKKTAKSEYLIEYKGKPIKKFRRSFKTACRRAGITYPCRMYDIRHLFASVMLAGGADLAAVSKLLGHSSTQMTANVYYELMKGEKEKAINLLPDISREKEKGKKILPFVSAKKPKC